MIFKECSTPSDAVIDLIQNTILGSNGARYKHLGVLEQLQKLDEPSYFSLIKGDKCLGNITLCKRPEAFYLRYFAFDAAYQANRFKSISSKPKSSLLRKEIALFFNTKLEAFKRPIYAYIEPENSRSINMALQFDFNAVCQIHMHHFSRFKPRSNVQFCWISHEEAYEHVHKTYGNYTYYFEHLNSGKFAGWRVDGTLIFIARFHEGCWEIQSLTGMFGKALTKIIPWIPLINKIINPKKHSFIAFDSLVVINKSVQKKELNYFFSAALAAFEVKHMMHWSDPNDPNQSNLQEIKWGLLHRFLGKGFINLMVKGEIKPGPYYVDAMDML